MATSDRWDELYEARERVAPLRAGARAADLYITCYDKPSKKHLCLFAGRRFVPYGFCFAGYAGINFDPRRVWEWRMMREEWEDIAFQQLAEVYPAGVVFGEPGTPYAGTVIGERPYDAGAQPQLGPGLSWYSSSGGRPGEWHPGKGSSYWSNDDVERETRLNNLYYDAYYWGLYWWLFTHGVNPGSVLPYEDELLGALQAIDIKEAGSAVMDELIDLNLPGPPDPDPLSENDQYTPPGSRGGTPYDPGAFTTASLFPGIDSQSLPFIAAGAVVAFAAWRKFGKSQGGK